MTLKFHFRQSLNCLLKNAANKGCNGFPGEVHSKIPLPLFYCSVCLACVGSALASSPMDKKKTEKESLISMGLPS